MMFAQPQWLWGLLGMAVPILIHLLGRRRRKTVPIASLMWLDTFRSQERRRSQLKDLLVLIFRTLAVGLIFLSLAGPRLTQTGQHVIYVDNYPARWGDRANWLPLALNATGIEGDCDIRLRGDLSLGTYPVEAVADVLQGIPPSSAPLVTQQPGAILSNGFADLPFPSPDFQLFLPERNLWLNHWISFASGETGQFSFSPAGDSVDFLWQLTENDQLVMESRSATFQPPKATRKSQVLALHGDSVPEDNTLRLPVAENLPVYVITLGSAAYPSAWPKPDSVYSYTGDGASISDEDAIWVLMGFDFLPKEYESAKGAVLLFSGESVGQKVSNALPELGHPFYSRYFLGASLQNRWPAPAQSATVDVQEALLEADLGVLAGLSQHEQHWRYAQGFAPAEADHPYYRAVWQWALEAGGQRLELQRGLGRDALALNLERWGGQVVRFGVGETKLARSAASFFTPEKITLLLALVCAVIALIFAKI